jgi:hypothetical protein
LIYCKVRYGDIWFTGSGIGRLFCGISGYRRLSVCGGGKNREKGE